MKKFFDKFDYKVEYKGNTVIEIIIIFIFLIILFFLADIKTAKANVLPSTEFNLTFLDKSVNPTLWYSFNGASKVTGNIAVDNLKTSEYGYLILKVCPASISPSFSFSNANSTTGFVASGSGSYNTGVVCDESSTWRKWNIWQLKIKKYEYSSNKSEYYTGAKLTITNKESSSNPYLWIEDYYLSDEDLLFKYQKEGQGNKLLEDLKNVQNQTNNKLDNIIDKDISSSDKQLPNDDSYQDYNNAESSLKDKVSQADMSNIDIAIDVNSSSFVWNTLSSFIQSHQLIFSMIISILSIGIIKLALGR